MLLLDEDGKKAEQDSKEYEDVYDIQEDSHAAAEEMLGEVAGPVSEAGMGEDDVELIAASLNEEMMMIRATLSGVETAVNSEDEDYSNRFLDTQVGLLDEGRSRAIKAREISQRLMELEPGRIEDLRPIRKELTEGVQIKYVRLLNRIAELRPLEHENEVQDESRTAASRAAGGSSGGSMNNYFKKRSFPEFSGNKRDYPTFHKEWKQCIAPNFPEEF